MKKNPFIISLLCLAVSFSLIGCDGFMSPNGDGEDGENNENQNKELLSPDEQKNFLVEVGEELINSFNPADQKVATDLADDLYHKYQDYDWNSIENEFEGEWEEFFSAEFDAFFGMPKRAIEVFNGKKNVQDLEILLSLSKFGRVIELDDKTQTVKITKSNDSSITAKFSDSKGVACEAKVWGEGNEIEASYTYEDYHWDYPLIWNEDWGEYYPDYSNGERVSDGIRTIKVEVPTTIKMHLKHGDNSLVSMNFTWDSNLKDYVNTSFDMQIINLRLQEESKITTTEATAVVAFSCGEKNLITIAASLPKYKLIGWDGGNDITKEEGENWIDEYEDKYASLLGKVGKGEASINILGKVLIKGTCTDGAALVDAYFNWNDKYSTDWETYWEKYERTFNFSYSDGGTSTGYYTAWWEEPRYTLEACKEHCDFLNKYTSFKIYYNNSSIVQAQIKLSTYEDNGTEDIAGWLRYENEHYYGYEYYTNLPKPVPYTCYNVEPVMYFPQDKTSTAVITYFKSSKFLGLVDLVEDLANSYIALDENNILGLGKVDFDI